MGSMGPGGRHALVAWVRGLGKGSIFARSTEREAGRFIGALANRSSGGKLPELEDAHADPNN
jgi:hypothetical protein